MLLATAESSLLRRDNFDDSVIQGLGPMFDSFNTHVEPNLRWKAWNNSVQIVTTKTIHKGSELLVDYGHGFDFEVGSLIN